MSHAFPDDATTASRGLDLSFSDRSSSNPVSLRLALMVIGGLSTAGWGAAALALSHLIG